MFDFHVVITSCPSFHVFIANQINDQSPAGLLVQLVEGWIGITEVKQSNPLQAWIRFDGLSFD